MVPVRSIRILIPPRFVSDHWAVKMQIDSDSVTAHRCYLHNRSQVPHIRPERDEIAPNALFAQLLTHCTRPAPMTYPVCNAWIAANTWALIDCRNAALRQHAPQPELCTIRKAIQKKVKWDHAIRLQRTGEEIQAHLDNNNAAEAWRLVKVWYRHNERAVPLTPADLTAIKQEYRALYTKQEPTGAPICSMVTYNIPDGIPDEDEIANAVRMLWSGWASGASGMSVEDIKQWHTE